MRVKSLHAAAWIMLSVLALAGCGRSPAQKLERFSTTSFATALTQSAVSQQCRKENNLAYEHTLSIELEASALANRMREIQEACTSDKMYGCTLLDVSLRSTAPSGTIRMRLAPAGVNVHDSYVYVAAIASISNFHLGSSSWQQTTVDDGRCSPKYLTRRCTLASSYCGSAK